MIDDNVVVLDGNYIMKANTLNFTHRAMIQGLKITSARFELLQLYYFFEHTLRMV